MSLYIQNPKGRAVILTSIIVICMKLHSYTQRDNRRGDNNRGDNNNNRRYTDRDNIFTDRGDTDRDNISTDRGDTSVGLCGFMRFLFSPVLVYGMHKHRDITLVCMKSVCMKLVKLCVLILLLCVCVDELLVSVCDIILSGESVCWCVMGLCILPCITFGCFYLFYSIVFLCIAPILSGITEIEHTKESRSEMKISILLEVL